MILYHQAFQATNTRMARLIRRVGSKAAGPLDTEALLLLESWVPFLPLYSRLSSAESPCDEFTVVCDLDNRCRFWER